MELYTEHLYLHYLNWRGCRSQPGAIARLSRCFPKFQSHRWIHSSGLRIISLPPVVFTSDLFWCLRVICSKMKVPGYGTDSPRSRTSHQISRIRSLVMGSCSDKIDFSVFLCFCSKFCTFLLSKLEVVIFIVDIVRFGGHLCTSLATRDLKIEVWSFYCKRQTAVWG